MKKILTIFILLVTLALTAQAADYVTRAEFLQNVLKEIDVNDRIYAEVFDDVTYKDKFADSVQAAVETGIINKGNLFFPNVSIKKDDALKMIENAFSYLKCDASAEDMRSLNAAVAGEYVTEKECQALMTLVDEIYKKSPIKTGDGALDEKINFVRDNIENCENEKAKNTAKEYFDIGLKKVIQNNSEAEVERGIEEINLAYGALNCKRDSIIPGSYIFDDNGGLIQGHGGNVFFDEKSGKYYWYGEARQTSDPPEHLKKYADWGWRIGVACYSSTDLYNWEYESLALEMLESYDGMKFPESDIKVGEVIERPKVMYNKKTDKYVMWMHIDNGWYGYSRAGVAVSDSPTGPFDYITSYRPGDKMSRDMTVFQDNDGTAYIYFSTDENGCLATVKLSEDYLEPVGEAHYCIWWKWREAPTVFRYKDTYYMITSGCTGWAANEADYATAPSPTGPWTQHGNPCVGEGANKTFGGQSYWVMTIDQEKGRFIFMADIWRPSRHSESSFIWLPIQMQPDGSIKIEWVDEWAIEDMGNMLIEPEDMYVNYGDEVKLPEKVKAIVRGEESEVPVLWEGEIPQRIGHYEMTGKAEGFANSFVTLDIFVMPRDICYFADCGADNTNELEKIQGSLYNSVSDMEYGVDEKTGKKWGYVSDNEKGHSGSNNMFNSVRYDYSEGGEENTGKGVTYSFEVEDAGEYAVYVGVKDPWNEQNRYIDIMVNGDIIVDAHNTHNTLEVFEKYDVKPVDGVITVSSIRDEKSLESHLDPIVSFIIIAKDNGEIVVREPEKKEDTPLEEKTEAVTEKAEEAVYRVLKLKGTVLALSYDAQNGLQMKSYNGTNTQKWDLEYTLSGSYMINA
ncbi:MAG: family 43 glycosylhydrolase, partial [Clostridia bacterium]|nr:family 43 glycosylhydrolase [Clostridia bacterium]